jgi:methylmalonyl-CoA epimerase
MTPVNRVHHTGMVVRSLDDAYAFYRDALGLRLLKEETIQDQGVRAALFDLGNSLLELLEPVEPDTGIARFLERRGEGLHHVCLEVDDIRAALADLKARGVPLSDEAPRAGLVGTIAFLHPSALNGVLVELVEAAGGPPPDGGPSGPVGAGAG